MKRTPSRSIPAALFFLALALNAFAQGPSKPGPEQQKLQYFTGNWVSQAEAKPGPFGPGGSMSMNETGKWIDGNYFVTIHSTFSSASMGSGSALAVMGYEPDEKKYTYDEFNSMGQTIHAKGTVDGDTWTWFSDMNMGPQTLKARYTQKILSPTSYTFKFEASSDKTKWDTLMEGKATKQ